MMTRSGQNCLLVMKAELSWHVQNCKPIGMPLSKSQKTIFNWFLSWADELFVRWVPNLIIDDEMDVVKYDPSLCTYF